MLSSAPIDNTTTTPMESSPLRSGFVRAIRSSHNPAKRRVLPPRRYYATPTPSLLAEEQGREPIRAAPPIRFQNADDQSTRAELLPSRPRNGRQTPPGQGDTLLSRIRIFPASPSYFTATPRFTDDILHLSALLRKYLLLPTADPGAAPRVAWKTWLQYRTELGEPIKTRAHSNLVGILKRLNKIHPSLFPYEVENALKKFKRNVQPNPVNQNPIVIDSYGRAKAVGRRKSSSAAVYLVEGNGECLINSRPLNHYFSRLHDRESALWALKSTDRLGNYNIFAKVQGGGTTGQAEAIMLGVSKALMVFEPELKTYLRKGKPIVYPSCAGTLILICCNSWCSIARPAQGREEEARQAQGQEDARLGQAVDELEPVHYTPCHPTPAQICAFHRRASSARISS